MCIWMHIYYYGRHALRVCAGKKCANIHRDLLIIIARWHCLLCPSSALSTVGIAHAMATGLSGGLV